MSGRLFRLAELSTIHWNMSVAPSRSAGSPSSSVRRPGVLDRVVALLEAVEAGAHTFTELVRSTGFSRTTTHRLIRELQEQEWLTFVGGYGYRLGPRLLRLATVAARELPLRDLASPAMRRLAEVTGESAQLYVRSADARICVDAVESANELRTFIPIGEELPLTAGSAGKIFLAWAPESDRRRLLRRAKRPTPLTPTGERLERQLVTARRRGWTSSSGERQPGVGSVSAPVLGPRGDLVAVVSVSGPATRMGRASAARYAPAVVAAAREIARALGVTPS
jgi:DNA-binding IclR family transcriptional regulator